MKEQLSFRMKLIIFGFIYLLLTNLDSLIIAICIHDSLNQMWSEFVIAFLITILILIKIETE